MCRVAKIVIEKKALFQIYVHKKALAKISDIEAVNQSVLKHFVKVLIGWSEKFTSDISYPDTC